MSDIPLRDFLNSRRTAIKEQIAALRAQLKEIEAAWQAIEGVATRPYSHLEKSSLTIQDMVRLLLRDFPDGLEALGIVREIKARFERDVMRESLSPQLSRMKEAGDITLEGKVWKLVQKETPGSDPGASV